VLWGGEFGRSPEAQDGKGRDHHNLGFTMWLAGGGVKGGQVVGATDAIGLRAVEEPVHFRDLHTTILNQLGLDQDQLTYLHLGRQERLTLVHGKVIKKLVGAVQVPQRRQRISPLPRLTRSPLCRSYTASNASSGTAPSPELPQIDPQKHRPQIAIVAERAARRTRPEGNDAAAFHPRPGPQPRSPEEKDAAGDHRHAREVACIAADRDHTRRIPLQSRCWSLSMSRRAAHADRAPR
jgi:hypothetical protein